MEYTLIGSERFGAPLHKLLTRKDRGSTPSLCRHVISIAVAPPIKRIPLPTLFTVRTLTLSSYFHNLPRKQKDSRETFPVKCMPTRFSEPRPNVNLPNANSSVYYRERAGDGSIVVLSPFQTSNVQHQRIAKSDGTVLLHINPPNSRPQHTPLSYRNYLISLHRGKNYRSTQRPNPKPISSQKISHKCWLRPSPLLASRLPIID